MNPINFYLYAKQAATEFVEANSDLNDSIAKIASREGLSQIQIQRVVELTNHEVNERLRNTADDKTFTFPLANLDEVLAKVAGPMPKTAGVLHNDIAKAIRLYNKGTGEASIEERCAMMKTASDRCQVLNRDIGLRKEAVLQKIAAKSRDVNTRKIGQLNKVAEELRAFVQTAKEMIITNKGNLTEMSKFANAVVPNWEKGWDTVFTAVDQELKKLGQPFTGRLASQSDFRRDRERPGQQVAGPVVKVVNGTHPLSFQVKKLHETISEATRMTDKLRDMDNFKDIVEYDFQDLTTNEAVDAAATRMYRLEEMVASDDAFSEQLLAKLGEETAEMPTRAEKAKALASIIIGEGASRASMGTLDAAATKLIHNYTPAAHQGPIKNMPQYQAGKN